MFNHIVIVRRADGRFDEWPHVFLDVPDADVNECFIGPLSAGLGVSYNGVSIPRSECGQVFVHQSKHSSTSQELRERFSNEQYGILHFRWGLGWMPYDYWVAAISRNVTDHYPVLSTLGNDHAESISEVASVAPVTSLSDKPPHLRVFVCHASDDKPAVREVVAHLKHDGFDVWLDEERLLPGADWEYQIACAIAETDVVLVCLSSASVSKTGFVQREVVAALKHAEERPEGAIFLIPVRLSECSVPRRLRKWQWVDLFGSGGYNRLSDSLRQLSARLCR